jgi:hypothetical protein
MSEDVRMDAQVSKHCTTDDHEGCSGRMARRWVNRDWLDRRDIVTHGRPIPCHCSCHATRFVSTLGGGTVGVLPDGFTVRIGDS